MLRRADEGPAAPSVTCRVEGHEAGAWSFFLSVCVCVLWFDAFVQDPGPQASQGSPAVFLPGLRLRLPSHGPLTGPRDATQRAARPHPSDGLHRGPETSPWFFVWKSPSLGPATVIVRSLACLLPAKP